MNKKLAAIFDQIADLMEIQGGDRFRINSYRRVARAIKELTGDVDQMHRDGSLSSIPGVGKGTADRIGEFIATGKIAIHQELLEQMPAGLPALLEIPGLGPKKVALAWKELGVEGVDGLKAEIASGRLAELPGLGSQSVKKIADGLAFLEKSSGRTPLGAAWPIAVDLAARVQALAGVKRVEIAGSLRRGQETIGDVDILCECASGGEVIKAFTEFEDVQSVLAAGDTKGSITVALSSGSELQVDLRVVPAASFGAALQYFTGSKEHNVRLREIAVKKKWKLNEYGLFDGEKNLAGRTEKSIYDKLKVPFVPPELREDRGEFGDDVSERIEGLIRREDLRGDLHMHTTSSDGKNSIEEMAAAARSLGHEYIAITDHSRSSAIANGLSIERMEEHIEAVRAADRKMKGITIFVGTEVDILANGRLDYPDDLLARCDVVVASVHSGLSQPRDKVTSRVMAALDNPFVTILGHPSGRLIGRREPMDLDWEAVIARAADTKTVLEINSSWQRLDLKDVHARMAVDAGVLLSIDTDSHRTDTLDYLRFGVVTARRGWVQKDQVLNASPLQRLRALLKRKR